MTEPKEPIKQDTSDIKVDQNGEQTETVTEILDDEAGNQQAELSDKQRLLDEQIDRYKRLQADFDNFRRRTRQEKDELSNFVAQNFVLDLLPIIDNFERALSAAKTQDAASMLSGVEMIYRQFSQVLEKAGLTKVEAVGQIFDPQQHEAVMRVEDSEQADGTIIEELQKGYAIRGRVIRPSMVKVVGN